ncbi:MAG TPA: NCS2 family permease [Kofleriaceae bacterium]|nr:NCS2 family permease [Kofleriaceae bacterium]
MERLFGIRASGSTIEVELVAGATTFMTMAYILFVNGAILSSAGLPAAQVLTVTALVAGVMTIAMGVYARYPFALAPGMGINAAVAGTLVATQQLTVAEAMGVIVCEGLAITLLVLVGIRERVLDAIPDSLKRAIGAGIGLFLAMIGLANGGVIAHGKGTLLTLGNLHGKPTIVFLVGLLLAFGLTARKIRGSLLIAIGGATLLAVILGVAHAPAKVFSAPDFSLVGKVSFGFFGKLGVLGAALAIFSLMLSDFFDTVGTAIGLAEEGGFVDKDGRLPGMKRVLLVDSIAAMAGGLASSSSATTYIESAAGIAAGARTGFASVVTGVLFLAAMFIGPLASAVPGEATASALVVVGFLMTGMLKDIDWKDVPQSAPAFLTAIVMPLTWSISNGIGAGVIAHVLLMTIAGRAREVHVVVWGVAVAFAVFFTFA